MVTSATTQILGRLTYVDSTQMAFACCQDLQPAVSLGMLIKAAASEGVQTVAVVTGIQWGGDGLTDHLAAEDNIPAALIEEEDIRNGKPVIRAVFVGCLVNGQILHLLPSRPPNALGCIETLPTPEWIRFTDSHNFLRLLYSARNEIPFVDITAHLAIYTEKIQQQAGNVTWMSGFIHQLVSIVERDPTLIRQLVNAISQY